jgi:hypothetical protein
LSWTFYFTSKTALITASSLRNLLELNSSTQFSELLSRSTTTNHSILPFVSIATKALVYGVILIALIFVFLSLINLRNVPSRIKFLSINLKSHQTELFFLISSSLFLILSFVLVTSSIGGWGFYVRSYFFYIFTISVYISVNFFKKRKVGKLVAIVKTGVIVLLLFATVVYPFTAFSIASYSSYPPSEGKGLEFLAKNVTLNGTSLKMYLPVHLLAYLKPSVEYIWQPFNMSNLLGSVCTPLSDITVFRKSMYFNVLLEYGANSSYYSETVNAIENNPFVDKVYSNPSFEVYLKK